jgi:hypothetical protein
MLFGGASIKENFQMLVSLPIELENPKPQIDYKQMFSLVGVLTTIRCHFKWRTWIE